jgi:hypothetical protein
MGTSWSGWPECPVGASTVLDAHLAIRASVATIVDVRLFPTKEPEVTATATPTFRVGDKVTPNPAVEGVPSGALGRIYTVAKINKVNIKATADDGGRGAALPPAMWLPATDEHVAKARDPLARLNAQVEALQSVEHFVLGEVVTLKRAYRDITTATPMVVTGGGAKVNVAKMGGDDDRYVRVHPNGLVRRDLAWLAEAMLEAATA